MTRRHFDRRLRLSKVLRLGTTTLHVLTGLLLGGVFIGLMRGRTGNAGNARRVVC